MMNKTKIDWADMTWNPVTGCRYKCPYCYAEKLALRYNPHFEEFKAGAHYVGIGKNGLYDISEPWAYGNRAFAHPFGFEPTFHRYRLEEPQLKKQPKNIFVCSMADLFGEWVPDEWIHEVLKSCAAAPQHTYLFLTKNPGRYEEVTCYLEGDNSPIETELKAYFGTSVTNKEQLRASYRSNDTWISIEPLLEDISDLFEQYSVQNFIHCDLETPTWNWVVIGAETGNRKGKIVPKREWIEAIVESCRLAGTPVFLKNSLTEIWGAPLIQEFPWETAKNEGGNP